jgi:hypothetical protein
VTAAERVLDGWTVDVERRARHYAAVIAAAHRLAAAEVLVDTDPTPPHGIVRPGAAPPGRGTAVSPVAVLCESRTAQVLATARAEGDARYRAAAGRTRHRGDRFAARIMAGPPKGWQP